jgi:hypothetical protein
MKKFGISYLPILSVSFGSLSFGLKTPVSHHDSKHQTIKEVGKEVTLEFLEDLHLFPERM